MKASEVKSVLKPLGILLLINGYRDEPSPSFHYLSIASGRGQDAIDAIRDAGGRASFDACGSHYCDSIQVGRK